MLLTKKLRPGEEKWSLNSHIQEVTERDFVQYSNSAYHLTHHSCSAGGHNPFCVYEQPFSLLNVFDRVRHTFLTNMFVLINT